MTAAQLPATFAPSIRRQLEQSAPEDRARLLSLLRIVRYPSFKGAEHV